MIGSTACISQQAVIFIGGFYFYCELNFLSDFK